MSLWLVEILQNLFSDNDSLCLLLPSYVCCYPLCVICCHHVVSVATPVVCCYPLCVICCHHVMSVATPVPLCVICCHHVMSVATQVVCSYPLCVICCHHVMSVATPVVCCYPCLLLLPPNSVLVVVAVVLGQATLLLS